MPNIQIKHHSSIYEVEYEYHPAQKADSETEGLPECYEITEIQEFLNDGSLSESLLFDFETDGLRHIENKIAKEVKNL